MAPLHPSIWWLSWHTQREGEHVAEWAEAERHRRRVGDANVRDRVESCLAVAEIGATDSEKETNEIPSLAKVTRKQQMFTSEMPIRVFIGSLSFHCINKHFCCAWATASPWGLFWASLILWATLHIIPYQLGQHASVPWN